MAKEKKKSPEAQDKAQHRLLTTALISIALSFIVATVVMLATQIPPGYFFKALLRTVTGLDFSKAGTDAFFKPRYIGEFLQLSLPLICGGMAVGFAYRTGMFNIGADGQVIAGIVGADVTALMLPLHGVWLVAASMIAAICCGALWALIPGLLKAFFGMHEVVTTIMFNYIAFHLNNYILTSLPGSNPQRTAYLPKDALLTSERMRQLTGNSRLHNGIWFVIIALFLYYFIINRTSFGYELRAVGFNRHASEYAGINARRRIVDSMLISGAFAGLGGAMVALGTFDYGRVLGGFENYGFDGIAVALLGGCTSVGILLGGLLMGALRSGQPLMQAMHVPLEIAQIVSALIILFVAMQHGIEYLLDRMQEKRKKRGEPANPEPIVTGENEAIREAEPVSEAGDRTAGKEA